MPKLVRQLTLKILAIVAVSAVTCELSAETLSLRNGDRICLVGNELGERMQHHNYWETLLHQRFFDHELAVRNLCFPGDEVTTRIRSKNFGSPDDHLQHSQASVIIYFFGFNESFAGDAGLNGFRQELTELIKANLQQQYDGSSAPRIVLISPIAFQDIGDPNLPDGSEHNPRLRRITRVMSAVADDTGVGFVDLFTPTRKLFAASDQRLTINGSHLNDAGYRALAPVLDQALFGDGTPEPIDETVRRWVAEKNFHWWHRYRAVNGYSIYGDRGQAGFDGTYRNQDVMEREREILAQMTANRDRFIWAAAAGKPLVGPVDDSNTPAFIQPKSNVGVPNDPNARAGKLGTLQYLTPEEQLKTFDLAPGFEINLFAAESQFPELANPVAINFDNQGRMWVSTMPSYPQWKPKTELADKLLILSDETGNGKADSCHVFMDGLHQPTGFELGHGGVFVAQQPDVLFVKDTTGDGKADHQERRLVGFCSADSHHGLAAFTWGPGGELFFQEGTFKFSQVESPYGLTRLAEAGVWRYNPRTADFGVEVSLAFSNPWGHVFDDWGQNFIADASPGFTYWAAPLRGQLSFPAKHPGGSQHRRLAEWTGGEAGYRHPTLYPQRIRPSAGTELVSSRHFPDDYQGNLLLANVIGERSILNYRIEATPTGYSGHEQEKLLSSRDGNFRPIDMQFGPDGALYIVDWHNALIGHLQHNLRDPNRDTSHGRIWRVSHKERPLLPPLPIAGAAITDLLEQLKAPELRTRYRVRRELAQRDRQEVIAELDRYLPRIATIEDTAAIHLQLELLWVYQTHHHVQRELLESLLGSADHRARAAAIRVLVAWRDQVDGALERLKTLVSDPHPIVRLEAVVGLSFFSGDEAIEAALEVLEGEMNDMLQYALDETMRALDP